MDPTSYPEDVRLRRFTLAVGSIFLIYTCGGASFESNEVSLLWLGKLKLENFFIIKFIIYGVAAYAFGLFIYRGCYLKHPPFRVRGWFKKYGVIVEFCPIEKIENRNAKKPWLLWDLCQSPPFKIEDESYKDVPNSYLKHFMISLMGQYSGMDEAVKIEVKYQVLEQYFPFIESRNLKIEIIREGSNTKKVSINNLDNQTKLLAYLEDCIYLLPIFPYAFSIICLLIPFLAHLIDSVI
ncbi:MAG: hypothetical protein R3B95_19810 [Nitrospirales bacterium]|nr:hypothetical protein [Nitrospirales bacterium]